MPINFPVSLDDFTNPTPADNLSTPAVLHSTQHSNVNDAIEALEAKVGVDSSTDAGSLDYLVSQLQSNSHAAVTIGTANGLGLSGQQLSLGLAASGVTGALSGTDWDTFAAKQSALAFPLAANLGGTGVNNGTNALTVPVTGTAMLLEMASVFNVLIYGAVGDGETDDTDAIQAAIDAAYAAGGGIVFIPIGTYLLTSSLVPKRAVTIRGVYPAAQGLTSPSSWDPNLVDAGTIITYPDGTVFQQDLSGGLGVLSSLEGCVIESLGFNDVGCVFSCGDTNKSGLDGGAIRDIIASNVTGIVLDLTNILNSSFTNIYATCAKFLRIASDYDSSVEGMTHQPGNCVFTNLYAYILPGNDATASLHGLVVAHGGNETNLNFCHFTRFQVNRYGLGTGQGNHILLEGTAAAYINGWTFDGLDLEGFSEYAVKGSKVLKSKFYFVETHGDSTGCLAALYLRDSDTVMVESGAYGLTIDYDNTVTNDYLVGKLLSSVGTKTPNRAALRETANTFTDLQTIALADPTDPHLRLGTGNVIDYYPPVPLTPTYSWSGGTGDRRTSITVSTNFSIGGGSNINLIIDGAQVTDGGLYWSPVAVSGKYFRFQFSAPVCLTEATYYYDASYDAMPGTTWKWQGSNNGSSWTDIGSPFVPASGRPKVFTELSGNTDNYIYYQMIGVSGTLANYEVPQEFEFELGGFAPATIQSDAGLSINPDGGIFRVQGYTLTVPSDLILAGQDIANTFTANQIVSAGYTLKTTGGATTAGLIAQAGANLQPAFQLNDYTGALAATINVRDNHSVNFVTVSNDGYFIFRTNGGFGVFVEENLYVSGAFSLGSNMSLGNLNYATSGTPLTTSPTLGLAAFGWNGSDGYTEITTAHFHLTKDDHTSGHGTLKAVVSASASILTPVVFDVDHTGKFTHYGNLFLSSVKSGATQVAAGAAAGEVWKTASHATLPDNVLMIGV